MMPVDFYRKKVLLDDKIFAKLVYDEYPQVFNKLDDESKNRYSVAIDNCFGVSASKNVNDVIQVVQHAYNVLGEKKFYELVKLSFLRNVLKKFEACSQFPLGFNIKLEFVSFKEFLEDRENGGYLLVDIDPHFMEAKGTNDEKNVLYTIFSEISSVATYVITEKSIITNEYNDCDYVFVGVLNPDKELIPAALENGFGYIFINTDFFNRILNLDIDDSKEIFQAILRDI